MKKGIVLGMVFLFVVMSFTSISGIQMNNQIIKSSGKGNTLYVGGSGEGNYTKIQDAIDDAVDGDTVYVFDDSSPYYENIIVSKSINLLGENWETTLISGDSDWVIEIKKDLVNISGFWIQTEDEYTNGISIKSRFCTISNNNIGPYFYDRGINIDNENNLIMNNKIFTKEFGIVIWENNNSIINNTITNNNHGIYGINVNNQDINILGNTFSYNGRGLWIHGMGYNISKNVFEYNEYSLHLECVDDTLIDSNIISNTDGIGIRISPECTGIVISRNVISNNYGGIYQLSFGPFWSPMNFLFTPNTRIIRNDINNNTEGIRLQCNSNLIFENNFRDNERHVYFQNCIINTWKGNYWGKPYDEPYRILGRIGLILPIWPFYNYDSTPAVEPYDINVNATQGCGIE